jgi:hypothetical protein
LWCGLIVLAYPKGLVVSQAVEILPALFGLVTPGAQHEQL